VGITFGTRPRHLSVALGNRGGDAVEAQVYSQKRCRALYTPDGRVHFHISTSSSPVANHSELLYRMNGIQTKHYKAPSKVICMCSSQNCIFTKPRGKVGNPTKGKVELTLQWGGGGLLPNASGVVWYKSI